MSEGNLLSLEKFRWYFFLFILPLYNAYRDFKQQLRMEQLRWPEVSCYTTVAENIKIFKQP